MLELAYLMAFLLMIIIEVALLPQHITSLRLNTSKDPLVIALENKDLSLAIDDFFEDIEQGLRSQVPNTMPQHTSKIID